MIVVGLTVKQPCRRLVRSFSFRPPRVVDIAGAALLDSRRVVVDGCFSRGYFRALLQLVVAPSVSCTVFGSITNWFAVHCAVSCLVRVCDLVLLITWRVRNTSGCIDHVSVPSRRTSCQKTGSSRTRSSIRCKWFFKRYFSSSLPVHRPPPCLAYKLLENIWGRTKALCGLEFL